MKRIIPILLMISIFLIGCAGEKVAVEEGEPISANVLFIIAQNNFRDEELSIPKQILESAGCNCKVASITTETAKGMLGARVNPDLAVKDADINNYDMIVVVGGSGAPSLMNYPEVLELLSQAKEQNKKIGSICMGPMVLAKGGALQGKRATVFETSESRAALEEGGAIFVGEDVVVDGNVVTANGPSAAKKFGNELVKLLRR